MLFNKLPYIFDQYFLHIFMLSKNRYFSKSSNWLLNYFNDPSVRKAHSMGIRSRAWFKLDSLDRSDNLFSKGMKVIDLGAAPGGWSQYVSRRIGDNGLVLACDIRDMRPLIGVTFIKGDLYDKNFLQMFLNSVISSKVHVVLSDMSPNMSGKSIIDIPKFINLGKLALNICEKVLFVNGVFLVKLFYGDGLNDYLLQLKSLFNEVKIRKPYASKSTSGEIYILAKGFNKGCKKGV